MTDDTRHRIAQAGLAVSVGAQLVSALASGATQRYASMGVSVAVAAILLVAREANARWYGWLTLQIDRARAERDLAAAQLDLLRTIEADVDAGRARISLGSLGADPRRVN